MKVDSLSKECVTISYIALVVSLILILIEADYNQVAFVAAALFSILIILGIKRRRVILIAPWLLAAFAGVTLSIIFYVGVVVTLQFSRGESMLYIIGIICAESMVLYTISESFGEIRRDRAKKLRRHTQLKGVTVK